ncbi:MAG: hypothetical protein IJ576_08925, partial [Synergistaceae bacterium]|nr:hypothetical protein [Synergistaceae bacterium]
MNVSNNAVLSSDASQSQELRELALKRLKENQHAENSEAQAAPANQTVHVQKTDEYDKDNPVGEKAEGIYSLEHDENGNLKIAYTQPEKTAKTETKSSDQSSQAAQPSQSQPAAKAGDASSAAKPAAGGAAPAAQSSSSESSSSSSSDSDEELEELK